MAQEEEALMLLRSGPLTRSAPPEKSTPPPPSSSPPPPTSSSGAATATPRVPSGATTLDMATPDAAMVAPRAPTLAAMATPRIASWARPGTAGAAVAVVGPWAHTATWAGDEVEAPTGFGELVHLRQEKVFVQLGSKEERDPRSWIYDTGATNHMTGSRSAFADLDTAVSGSVRFGDDSVAEIEGCGMVLFPVQERRTSFLRRRLLHPGLTANIVSLGQLEEADYDIHLRSSGMEIRDPHNRTVSSSAKMPWWSAQRVVCLRKKGYRPGSGERR